VGFQARASRTARCGAGWPALPLPPALLRAQERAGWTGSRSPRRFGCCRRIGTAMPPRSIVSSSPTPARPPPRKPWEQRLRPGRTARPFRAAPRAGAVPLLDPVPSLATFLRAVRRDLTPGERAGFRGGPDAARALDVFGKRPRLWRNHVWEADHVQAPLRIEADGELVRPHLTWFVDCATKAITGVAVTPGYPSRASILAALRAAVLGCDPYGPSAAGPSRSGSTGAKTSSPVRSPPRSELWARPWTTCRPTALSLCGGHDMATMEGDGRCWFAVPGGADEFGELTVPVHEVFKGSASIRLHVAHPA
jgi:hypothetical protein